MLLTLFVVIVNTVTSYIIQNIIQKTRLQTSSTIRRLEYIGKLAWHIDYAKEVRAYDCKQYIVDKYNVFNEFVLKHIFRDYKIEKSGQCINSLAGAIQTLGLYIILGLKVLSNVITLGDFSMLMSAINTFQGSLSGLFSNVIDIQNQSKYFTAYIEYIQGENLEAAEKDNNILSLTCDTDNKSLTIEFCNVSYRYPGQEKFALENINVVINKSPLSFLVKLLNFDGLYNII